MQAVIQGTGASAGNTYFVYQIENTTPTPGDTFTDSTNSNFAGYVSNFSNAGSILGSTLVGSALGTTLQNDGFNLGTGEIAPGQISYSTSHGEFTWYYNGTSEFAAPPDSYSTILFVQIGSNVASSLSGAVNVDDNGVATVAAFAPVPEPLVLSGLAALVAMGGVGLVWRRKASLPTEEIGPLPARKSVEGVYQAKASRPTASLLSFPVPT